MGISLKCKRKKSRKKYIKTQKEKEKETNTKRKYENGVKYQNTTEKIFCSRKPYFGFVRVGSFRCLSK